MKWRALPLPDRARLEAGTSAERVALRRRCGCQRAAPQELLASVASTGGANSRIPLHVTGSLLVSTEIGSNQISWRVLDPRRPAPLAHSNAARRGSVDEHVSGVRRDWGERSRSRSAPERLVARAVLSVERTGKIFISRLKEFSLPHPQKKVGFGSLRIDPAHSEPPAVANMAARLRVHSRMLRGDVGSHIRNVDLEGLRYRLVDAKGEVVGRLASKLSMVLQGKAGWSWRTSTRPMLNLLLLLLLLRASISALTLKLSDALRLAGTSDIVPRASSQCPSKASQL